MTPRLDQTESAHDPVAADAVQRRLEAIEGSLLAQLTNENRYGSGVPSHEPSSDLEFIQMTGLTQPFTVSAPPRPAPPVTAALRRDLDEQEPVDFFQRGVADVDHLAGPPGLEPRPLPRAPAVPQEAQESRTTAVGPSSSADALKELIADLTRPEEEMAAEAPLAPPEFETPVPTIDAPEPAPFEDALPADEGYAPEPANVADERPEWESPSPEFDAGHAALPEEAPLAPAEEPVSLERLLEEMHGTSWDEPVGPPEVPEISPEAAGQPFFPGYGEQTAGNPAHADVEPGYAVPAAPERRLAEAEELLHALERQPRDVPQPDPEPLEPIHRPFPEQRDGLDATDEASGIMRAQSSQRRVYRRSRRRIIRNALAVVGIILAGIGAYYAYHVYLSPMTASPGRITAEATSLMQQGEYVAAAQQWRLFLQRFPDHGDSAEARFQVAFAYFLARPSSDDEARDFARRAIVLFDEFVEYHPGHRKAIRAACMVGVLHYRLQQYDRAIAQLRPLCEPARRGEDPEVVLPAMRTLARSYSRHGDYVEAEEMYEAAASLERNLTPEVDYYELGNLCIERARIATDASEKLQLQNKALAYWDNALRAPGIDPQERERIRTQRNSLAQQMGAVPATEAAVQAEAAGVSSGADVPAPQPESPTPDAVREFNPNEEAQQLSTQSAPSS